MALTFQDSKNVSNQHLVTAIVDEIRKYPNIFLRIARLFSIYKKSDSHLPSEIYVQAKLFLSMERNLTEEQIEFIAQKLKCIYELVPDKFSDIRSKILESVTYYFGPVTKGLECEMRFVEPVILDDTLTVGNSEIKCDLVFYYNDTNPLEFVECKADIGNVIPRTYAFEKAKKSHQDKLRYLDSAYHYLKSNYCEPRIYFACYNMNYKEELNNLQNNWGFGYINFVNPIEIINGK